MTVSQTTILQQPVGFPFDSSDYAMNSSKQYSTLSFEKNISMDEWKDDEGESEDERIEDDATTIEIDPDLYDEDEVRKVTETDNEVSDSDEDDVFEQYLFGEEEEEEEN